MQSTTHMSPRTDLPVAAAGLPGDRDHWPNDALRSFRDLVGELDRWCRDHDWPPAANLRIAEEAIRKCW